MNAKRSKQTAHFVGIGGIGISALARWFKAKKWAVSGSDIAESELTQELKKEGLQVKIGHAKANVPKGVGMVVYNAAIALDNQEIKEAIRQGIKPLSYAETIGCLTQMYRTIAIAGSHGKSTTTSLTGLLLVAGKKDPTIIVGTKLRELDNKNVRVGGSNLLVLEADEWNGSFLHYSPTIAAVTNIDKEHLDHYKNLGNVKKSFLSFLGNTKEGGHFILNRDSQNLWSLRHKIERLAAKKQITVHWYTLRSAEAKRIQVALQLPGRHNVSNALIAYEVGRILGVHEKTALRSLSQYHGAWRRMELRGQVKSQKLKVKSLVYDDYAHHPTEIKATLQAFREKFPKSNLVCVYQPHQAKRLKALYSEFKTAFKEADTLIFLPTYEVVGRDNQEKVYTSAKLARDIQKKYPKKKVIYLANPKRIKEEVTRLLSPQPSVIIMMGAGSIVNYTPLLLR